MVLERTRKTIGRARKLAREHPLRLDGIVALGVIAASLDSGSLDPLTVAQATLTADLAQTFIGSSGEELRDYATRIAEFPIGFSELVSASFAHVRGNKEAAIEHANRIRSLTRLAPLGEFTYAYLTAEAELPLAASHYAHGKKLLEEIKRTERRKGILAHAGTDLENFLMFLPVKLRAERMGIGLESYSKGALLHQGFCAAMTGDEDLAQRSFDALYRKIADPKTKLLVQATVAEALGRDDTGLLWMQAVDLLDHEEILKEGSVTKHRVGVTSYVVKKDSYKSIQEQEKNLRQARTLLEGTPYTVPKTLTRKLTRRGSPLHNAQLLIEYIDGPTLAELDVSNGLLPQHFYDAAEMMGILHEKMPTQGLGPFKYRGYLLDRINLQPQLQQALRERYGVIDYLLTHSPQSFSLDSIPPNIIVPQREKRLAEIDMESHGIAAIALDHANLFGGVERAPISYEEFAQHYARKRTQHLDPRELALNYHVALTHLGFVYAIRAPRTDQDRRLRTNYLHNASQALTRMPAEFEEFYRAHKTDLDALPHILNLAVEETNRSHAVQ